MAADDRTGSLLLLCHSGGWDRLYQAFSAAATSASLGRAVTIVFFFGALDRLARGELDVVTLEPREEAIEARLRRRIDEIGTPELSELLAAARKSGKVRLLACSASAALMDHDTDELADRVDEIVGWPTVTQIMGQSDHTLYL